MAQTNYKWYVIVMLWFVCFLNYADRQAIFALLPLLRASLHLSDLQLAFVGSSFMWMYALSGPLAGWLGLTPLPLSFFGWMAATMTCYVLVTHAMKTRFIAWYGAD